MVLEESVHSIPLCLLLLLGPNTQQNHHITQSITIQHTKNVVWCRLFPIIKKIHAMLNMSSALPETGCRSTETHMSRLLNETQLLCSSYPSPLWLTLTLLSMLYTLGYTHHHVCSWWDKYILSVPLAPSSIWQEAVGVWVCQPPTVPSPSQHLTLYGVIKLLGPPLRPPWQHTNIVVIPVPSLLHLQGWK